MLRTPLQIRRLRQVTTGRAAAILLWQGVYNFMCFFTTLQKMRNNYIVGIIVSFVGKLFSEQGKIIVVNVKVNHSVFANSGHKGIVIIFCECLIC
jgi:hypothetical protein